MRVRGAKSGFRRTIPFRRSLRHNLTPAERMFWSKVAQKQFLNLKFRKQYGIGSCIVDFYCSERRLVVEIDGDTHASAESILKDKNRTDYLKSLGYNVIRYNNFDVISNIDGVFEDLSKKIIEL